MHYTDPVTLDDLETLAAVDTSPTVSLYLPTSRHSKETDKDIIILKNLRREAAMKLSSSGLPDDEIDTLLAPVDDLLDEREFWPRLSEDRSPLVLAGVDYLLPIYREITSYRYLADGEIAPPPTRGDAR